VSFFRRLICERFFHRAEFDSNTKPRDMVSQQVRDKQHALANSVTEIDSISNKILRDAEALVALTRAAREMRGEAMGDWREGWN